MLESLARSNLFLVPLDRTGEWYRYHHLFRELLRAELERLEPDLVPQLLACRRLVRGERAAGDRDRYAQAAGDVDRVAELFVRCALAVYYSGRAATVDSWLTWLAGKWEDGEPDARSL